MNTENELPEIAPQALPAGAAEIEPAAIETLAAVVAESQAAVLAEISAQPAADGGEEVAEPGRKWREGRIVDAAVRVWDASERTGVADVVNNGDEPPLSVFLVGSNLFKAW